MGRQLRNVHPLLIGRFLLELNSHYAVADCNRRRLPGQARARERHLCGKVQRLRQELS